MEIDILSRYVNHTTFAQGVLLAVCIPLEYLHDATSNREEIERVIGKGILDEIYKWRADNASNVV